MKNIVKWIVRFFNLLFKKKPGKAPDPPKAPVLEPPAPPEPPNPQVVITHLKIKPLYPRIQEKCQLLINRVGEAGIDADIFMGLRTFAEQAKLYAKGRTEAGSIVTNCKPGYSYHNYGLAVDIVFKKNGGWSWDAAHDWPALGRIGKELGFVWGGDWGWDMPHFEMTFGKKTGDLLVIYDRRGRLEDVWKELDALI